MFFCNEIVCVVIGREQALLAGARLRELGLPYQLILNSSMKRAKETSDVIAKELTSVSRLEDNLLREGAPFPPEPKPKFYTPLEHVSIQGELSRLNPSMKCRYNCRSFIGMGLELRRLFASTFIALMWPTIKTRILCLSATLTSSDTSCAGKLLTNHGLTVFWL